MPGNEKVKTNPYDYMRPVTDCNLFAGRTEELKIIKEEISKIKGEPSIPPVVALSGERRVGKTSILYRIEELCREENIITARLSLTESIVSNPWNFWQVIFDLILNTLNGLSISFNHASFPHKDHPPIGFQAIQSDLTKEPALKFPSYYKNERLTGAPLSPAAVVDDVKLITSKIGEKGYAGLVLMLDEAHSLVDLNEIQQQLRDSLTQANRVGVVFAGEPLIGRMFNDPSNRFFHQGTVMQVRNFHGTNDVAECAIKPLTKEERSLMSPMTIDYLAKLSQGKPNQIRLICSSIYSNYMNNNQEDLNINIDTLNDVLQVIASGYTEYDLKRLVEKINNLATIDLELLYRITRYPNWSTQQVIDLDESFRGETKSSLAEERRRRLLLQKREKLIKDGLLKDVEDRCILAGDEFTYLYVRFLYEIRKYGGLARRLELGKGPPTPFSEKIYKLVESLSFELGRYPRIRHFIRYEFNVETNEIRARVRQRFSILENLIKGQRPDNQGLAQDEILEILGECFQICELVEESGPHHYISILVRNAQNVNELMHVELFFDPVKIITLVSPATAKLLKQQAEQANVWIEDIDDFKIANLPNLRDLLQIVGAPSLEETLQNADDVIKWRIESVQRIVTAPEESVETSQEKTGDLESDDGEAWIRRYDSADEKGAIEILDRKMANCTSAKDNPKLAKYYNDRGYIKSTTKLNMLEEAKRDLDKAIAYHYDHLELPLLNLSVIHIDQEDYPAAILKIEDALFFATTRQYIMASYLRLRLVARPLTPIWKMEQRPANVIEAAYINLAYAQTQTNHSDQALETIEEGLSLFPSSYRLKHAKARIQLFRNRADLADDIYEELSKMIITDAVVAREVADYVRRFVAKKRRKKSSHR
jgi:hypothetical protein